MMGYQVVGGIMEIEIEGGGGNKCDDFDHCGNSKQLPLEILHKCT